MVYNLERMSTHIRPLRPHIRTPNSIVPTDADEANFLKSPDFQNAMEGFSFSMPTDPDTDVRSIWTRNPEVLDAAEGFLKAWRSTQTRVSKGREPGI